MKVHQLKTTATWFDRVARGQKTAEIRKHDRDFQVGDILDLIEIWESDGRHYDADEDEQVRHRKGEATGRCEAVVVTHILPAAQFPEGLREGYCLLSFAGGEEADHG